MTSRPSRFLIVGPKVLERMSDAPERIKRSFHELIGELALGPYPDQHPRAAEARGVNRKHLYVAWKDDVELMYLVMQDQPVISLVGVHWRGPDDGGDNGGGEPVDWTWTLAA